MSYQPEERYWTDYLRVALPVVGLLLMLGLFLFWANQLINPDENPPTQVAVIIEDDEGAEVIEAASPAATPTSAPDLAANPPANDGAGAPTNPPEQSATLPTATMAPPPDDAAGDQPADTNEETSAGEDTATDGGFAIDDTVRVTEDGVNLRSATSTESSENIVGMLNEGDLVQIIGGPEEGASYTWYQVRLEEADGSVVEGWVAGSFLEAA
ncbi:MAG TPA: SH3 domain-containing protein [Thermomicrobiales bacterium]|nr:SH3 domain-containing protein [Thermomicrobiales bacterium]